MNDGEHVPVVKALLVAHRDELIAFAVRRAGGKQAAEDVVQLAALRALASAAQLRDPQAGRAWLFRITRSVLAEQYRRRHVAASSASTSDGSPERDEVFGCRCVLANLKRCKPEHAEILGRVVVDGVSIASAAGELGITVNAATVRVHRARESLKQRLRAHCGTDSLRACLDCSCAERGCCEDTMLAAHPADLD